MTPDVVLALLSAMVSVLALGIAIAAYTKDHP